MNKIIKTLKVLAIYVIIIGYIVVALFPVLWIVFNSFRTLAEIFSTKLNLEITPTLKNYIEVLLIFQGGAFLKDIFNSFAIASLSTLVVMLMALPAGYAFSRFEIKYKENLMFFILTTRMAPPVAFALPLYVMYTRLGLIDTHVGMVLIYTFFNIAFAVWLSKSFFDEVPIEVEEAAMVDGCTRVHTFFKIALPLASRGLIATALLSFILTWNEFFWAVILTRGNARTFPVSLTGFVGAPRLRYDLMTAASTIGIIIPITLAIILRKYLVRGFTFGIIKG